MKGSVAEAVSEKSVVNALVPGDSEASGNQFDTAASHGTSSHGIIKIETDNVDVFESPRGLGYSIFEGLQMHSGKIIQIDIDNGDVDTAKNLLQRSVRTAIQMRNLGIEPGDVISIYSHSQMNCASVFSAAIFLGAVNASLDPIFSEEEVEYLVSEVTPKMVFVSIDCEEVLQNVVDKLGLDTVIVVFGESKNNLSYSTFVVPMEDEMRFSPWVATNLNDTILIMFSSGTTGLAKGVCYNHHFAMFHSRGQLAPVSLFISTIYWSSPALLLISVMRFGGTKAFTKSVDLKMLWNHIETYHIDIVLMSPYLVMQFLENHPQGLISSLQCLAISGGSTTLKNMRKLKEIMPHTFIATPYGQTEASIIFDNTAVMMLQEIKFPSVGTPYPYISYKVVDLVTGANLGPNQKGELMIKTKYICNGYYKRNSSDIFDEEGYLKTGDVFYYDEDMHFYMVDRMKEMFKFRGHHVTPAKYEAILQDHPDIELAAVIGIPHHTDDNHICAAVQLKSGSRLSPNDVEVYYNERVGDIFKIRAGVIIVASMPMTPSGKLKRKEVIAIVLKKK